MNNNNKKTVFFWNPKIDHQLLGTHQASGIEIQMGRWAKTFVSNGWKAYGITEQPTTLTVDGITFIPNQTASLLSKLHLSIIQEFLWTLKTLKRYNPNIVLFRGASRKLYSLSIVCNILNIKLCFFGASDVNFIPGKDTINRSERDTKIYRKALKNTKYIVTQNDLQSKELKKYYDKHSISIPNIWIDPITKSNPDKKYDAIWVSHLRPLKRAEWFITAAQTMPDKTFLIVGGSYDDNYYAKIKHLCENIPNIEFLGPKSEKEVNRLIDQSRLFVCTSEYEGFPNTFLQSWAVSVPVISTVDPSGIIESNNLGAHINTPEHLIETLRQFLDTPIKYKQTTENIYNFFINNYDTNKRFAELINYLQ